MKTDFDFNGAGIFGIIIGICGVAFAGWQAKKTREACNKLGVAMESVEKNTPVDIRQDIVDKAIERAVDREVVRASEKSIAVIQSNMKDAVHKRVKEAVDDDLSRIDTTVKAKAKELVDGIDKEAFRQKIVDAGAETLSNDFSHSLDGLLADAKSKVTYMTSTISGLAEAFLPIRKPNSGNGISFRLD